MINISDDDTVDKYFLETKKKPSVACFKLDKDEDFELASDMHRRVKSKMNKQYSFDMKLLRAAVGDDEKNQFTKCMKRLRGGVNKLNQE